MNHTHHNNINSFVFKNSLIDKRVDELEIYKNITKNEYKLYINYCPGDMKNHSNIGNIYLCKKRNNFRESSEFFIEKT